MSITFTIIPSVSLAYTHYKGARTYAQRVEYSHTSRRDPKYPAQIKKLSEMRQCRHYSMLPEEENFVSRKMDSSGRFAGERCAVCAPQKLQYGMSRMHATFMSASSIKTMVFRNFDAALEWLGLQPQYQEFPD